MPNSGQIILWVFQAIPQLPAQTGTINLAPGYEQAILTIAAAELCIAFQRPLTPDLANSAAQSKDVIIQLNAEIFDAPMPAPAGPSPVSPPAVKRHLRKNTMSAARTTRSVPVRISQRHSAIARHTRGSVSGPCRHQFRSDCGSRSPADDARACAHLDRNLHNGQRPLAHRRFLLVIDR